MHAQKSGRRTRTQNVKETIFRYGKLCVEGIRRGVRRYREFCKERQRKRIKKAIERAKWPFWKRCGRGVLIGVGAIVSLPIIFGLVGDGRKIVDIKVEEIRAGVEAGLFHQQQEVLLRGLIEKYDTAKESVVRMLETIGEYNTYKPIREKLRPYLKEPLLTQINVFSFSIADKINEKMILGGDIPITLEELLAERKIVVNLAAQSAYYIENEKICAAPLLMNQFLNTNAVIMYVHKPILVIPSEENGKVSVVIYPDASGQTNLRNLKRAVEKVGLEIDTEEMERMLKMVKEEEAPFLFLFEVRD